MSVQGAIFDCDGTILDSMPMWTQVCVDLLRRYGVADAERVFQEHESLDMEKKCEWYHENLGIGASTQALVDEMRREVKAAYSTTVRPYAGCEDFLHDLRQARVPCIIVSSTPPDLVEYALRVHGLNEYFCNILLAGAVGRGKEHPDCYLAALRELGTPREHTWVFEDAPFGVRSAVRAGLPTVAILNDHDGRDPEFMDTWATLVTASYADLSISTLNGLSPRMLNALVVAGSPQQSSPQTIRRLAQESDLIIAADHGANALYEANVVPHVFCGDEDSVDKDVCVWARNMASRVERYPTQKDDTDLGLAISIARSMADEQGSALNITLTCASGGRPDHALGVWGVLVRNADLSPRVVEDDFVCKILSPLVTDSWIMRDLVGSTVSCVALAPNTVISEQGMRWELDHEPLEVLSDRGVSNYVMETSATVCCHMGAVAVFLIL